MTVILAPEVPFEELLGDIAKKFEESARFWGSVQMTLTLAGRPLAPEQEFQIANVIMEHSQIEIVCLVDLDGDRTRRCEKALNEKLMELSSATGQFYESAVIVALTMAPVQLKIGDLVTKTNEKGRRLGRGAMKAEIENGEICVSPIKKSFFNVINSI